MGCGEGLETQPSGKGSPSGRLNQTQMGGWGGVGPRGSWGSGSSLMGCSPACRWAEAAGQADPKVRPHCSRLRGGEGDRPQQNKVATSTPRGIDENVHLGGVCYSDSKK